MKTLLMHGERDFDPEQPLPSNETTLTADLELGVLFGAMAAGDPFLFEISRRALLLSLRDRDEIDYRQDALRDCLENPTATRSSPRDPSGARC